MTHGTVSVNAPLLNLVAKKRGIGFVFSLDEGDLGVSLKVHGIPVKVEIGLRVLTGSVAVSIDKITSFGINISKAFRGVAIKQIMSELSGQADVVATVLPSQQISLRTPIVVTGIGVDSFVWVIMEEEAVA